MVPQAARFGTEHRHSDRVGVGSKAEFCTEEKAPQLLDQLNTGGQAEYSSPIVLRPRWICHDKLGLLEKVSSKQAVTSSNKVVYF